LILETTTFGADVVAGDGPREEAVIFRLLKLFLYHQHFCLAHRVDFQIKEFLHRPENAVIDFCARIGWFEPGSFCAVKLCDVDFSPLNTTLNFNKSRLYIKGAVLDQENKTLSVFKFSTSADTPQRFEVPNRNVIVLLRLKQEAFPTSTEIGSIRIPLSATFQGSGLLRLPVFCSKTFPRTVSQVRDRHHQIIMCFMTFSFENSFAAHDGDAYNNEALPWQLQALQSLSESTQRSSVSSFTDDLGNVLAPRSDDHGNLSVQRRHRNSRKLPCMTSDNTLWSSVFYEFSQLETAKASEACLSVDAISFRKDLPIYMEFLRCRDLPKMDTFGSCDCFITCGNLNTECIKNTQ
jgi:hypothetical protein